MADAMTGAPMRAALTDATDDGDRAILSVSALELSFGGVRALAGTDLEVRRGSITALIGPNGAGKTTLFNAITGFYRADRGNAFFDGRPLLGKPPHAIARLGMARTFQLTKTLARVLMLEPRLILLDEPMAGINPALAQRLLGHIHELREGRGVTFLFIEHDMEVVMGQSDRVIVMSEGRVIAEGTPEQVSRDPHVIDAYLGSSGEAA